MWDSFPLTKGAAMESTTENHPPRPLYERALRFIVVGTLTLILLYIKALGAILKMGIGAVRKIPMGGRK
jgi:hypothetical protein